MVRFGFTPAFFNARAASNTATDPVPLSVAPSEIPRIQVRADDHYLIWFFAPSDFRHGIFHFHGLPPKEAANIYFRLHCALVQQSPQQQKIFPSHQRRRHWLG